MESKRRRREQRQNINRGQYDEMERQHRMVQKETSGFIPRKLSGRTPNQVELIRSIAKNDFTFCSGPAGSGKTHIAVAMAAKALRTNSVGKIVLTRPAVESGKSLGYLPGDLADKLDPYLRPLFDELEYYIDRSFIEHYMDHGLIEICPLNYMRGRTFNNAFVVLDEAQNAEEGELRMCMTRLGIESKMVMVGDVTQSDLPTEIQGGFAKCFSRLTDLDGVGLCRFTAGDIVRHRLIGEIEKRMKD